MAVDGNGVGGTHLSGGIFLSVPPDPQRGAFWAQLLGLVVSGRNVFRWAEEYMACG